MKKTLVALAVAAVAATSANAAVVYDQNGSKVEVGGSLRLLLTKDSSERGDLKNAGSRIVVKGSQDLGNGLSALANVEIRFEGNGDEEFGSIETKRLFAGFKQDQIGTLTFGRQLTNLDDVGLSDYTYDLGGVNQTKTSANKSVKFRSVEWAGLSFGADYWFDSDEDRETVRTRGWGASLFYTVDLAQDLTFNFNAGYSESNKDKTVEVSTSPNSSTSGNITTITGATTTITVLGDIHKERAFTVGTELVYGPVSFAVDYSQTQATNSVNSLTAYKYDGTAFVAAVNRIRQLGVGAKYQYLDNASVYTQLIWGRGRTTDSDPDILRRSWVVGTDYALHKNVVTYVEGGSSRYTQGDDKFIDNKARVGLRIFF